MTSSLDPDLKIAMTLASFIRSGKIPFLKDKLKILTSWGMIIGAANFSIFIGISEGPDDLLSSSKRSIVMTLVMVVDWKVKSVKTLLRRNVRGDIGVLGILLSILSIIYIFY